MPRAAFAALGTFVPDRVVTNEELTRHMETTDAWIQERTGIRERRWVREGTENSDLALEATKRALDEAGLEGDRHRGDRLRLALARSHVPGRRLLPEREARHPRRARARHPQPVLRVPLRALRRGRVDPRRRLPARPARRLGDPLDRPRRLDPRPRRGGDLRRRRGRGAARGDRRPGPRRARRCTCTPTAATRRSSGPTRPAPSTTRASRPRMIESGAVYPHMEGQKVFKHAISEDAGGGARRAREGTALTTKDLKLLVPAPGEPAHQPDGAALASSSRDDQVFNNIQKYGNTTAGSIPHRARGGDRGAGVKRGDLVGSGSRVRGGFHLGERPGTLVVAAARAEGPALIETAPGERSDGEAGRPCVATILRRRPTAGLRTLDPRMKVRILPPQPARPRPGEPARGAEAARAPAATSCSSRSATSDRKLLAEAGQALRAGARRSPRRTARSLDRPKYAFNEARGPVPRDLDPAAARLAARRRRRPAGGRASPTSTCSCPTRPTSSATPTATRARRSSRSRGSRHGRRQDVERASAPPRRRSRRCTQPGTSSASSHCPDSRCAMFLSRDAADSDRKGPGLCASCRAALGPSP